MQQQRSSLSNAYSYFVGGSTKDIGPIDLSSYLPYQTGLGRLNFGILLQFYFIHFILHKFSVAVCHAIFFSGTNPVYIETQADGSYSNENFMLTGVLESSQFFGVLCENG